MSTQAKRGLKRTCQNEECGARFYDLMRDPIACPVCHSAFVPPPPRSTEPRAPWKSSRTPVHHPIVQDEPVAEAEVEAADPNSDDATETAGDETVSATEKPDLILELDDDDEDETNVVEVPAAEDEKA